MKDYIDFFRMSNARTLEICSKISLDIDRLDIPEAIKEELVDSLSNVLIWNNAQNLILDAIAND
jgi:hypothetical protein